MRNFGLLFIGAAALAAPSISARGAQPATAGPLVLQAKCLSANTAAACTSCAVTLTQDLKQPSGDRALTGSCPRMAAGRYSLTIAVPVELVPAHPAAKIFAQLQESFAASSRDPSGRADGALADTPPVTWSWWGPAGFVIDQTTPVTLDRDAGIDIRFELRNLRYFIPHRTQGPPHHDGELIVPKAKLISLERLSVPNSAANRAAELGVPHEFSAKLLAEVVPGRTTEKEVATLLGEPWRTDAGDEDEAVPESWDYRAKGANGTYILHIEFDARGRTSLVVKVPDKSGTAAPIPAPSSAGRAKP